MQGSYTQYVLAVLDSGNFALNLLRILERKGYYFEFMSIPCPIARQGCGYCIKLPMEHLEMLIEEGNRHGLVVRTVYKVIPGYLRNRYELIWEKPSQNKRYRK